MTKKLIVTSLVLVLLILLVLLKPSKKAHIISYVEYVQSKIADSEDGLINNVITNLIAKPITEVYIREVIIFKDYVFFSTSEVNIPRENDLRVIGVMGNTFFYKK